MSDAFFLPGASGPVFSWLMSPAPGTERGHGVLCIPPFAEEMNRSRRMMALQARALAAAGHHVLVHDPYGTGDSAGDFAQARLEIWREDLDRLAGHLRERGARTLSLWCIRFGALLGLDWAASRDLALERVVLWQPMHSGEALITQLLRLRLAAQIARADAPSMQRLREELSAGSLEIAGYELTSGLAADIQSMKLERLVPRTCEWAHLFELAPQAVQLPTPAGRALREAWQAQGIDTDLTVVQGEPFWSLQETTIAPSLIDATGRVLQ